jgi:nucleotide-binding universal stress UspA family protein
MLRTVMLPTDFSEESENILGFAKGLPALGVKVVVLLHVVEASGLEGPIIATRVDDACDRLRGVAAALEAAGLSVEVRVPTGDPFDTIVGLASEMGVDAIVCGSHAKGLMTQLVAGSVSERLLRDAPVPMLLVRFDLLKNQSDPTTLLKRFGEKVLMPTDFSLSASHAFTAAMELPKGLIKTLYLMHVVDAGLTGEKLRKTEEGAEFHLRNLQAILEELDERRATAVITGTRGRNAVQEALMGSVSMTLLKQASCPVMIVP